MSSYNILKKALAEATVHECITTTCFHLVKVARLTMHGRTFDIHLSSWRTRYRIDGFCDLTVEEIRRYHSDSTRPAFPSLAVTWEDARFTTEMHALIQQEQQALDHAQLLAFLDFYRNARCMNADTRADELRRRFPPGRKVQAQTEVERELSHLFIKNTPPRAKRKPKKHLTSALVGHAVSTIYRLFYEKQCTSEHPSVGLYAMRYKGISDELLAFTAALMVFLIVFPIFLPRHICVIWGIFAGPITRLTRPCASPVDRFCITPAGQRSLESCSGQS